VRGGEGFGEASLPYILKLELSPKVGYRARLKLLAIAVKGDTMSSQFVRRTLLNVSSSYVRVWVRES